MMGAHLKPGALSPRFIEALHRATGPRHAAGLARAGATARVGVFQQIDFRRAFPYGAGMTSASRQFSRQGCEVR